MKHSVQPHAARTVHGIHVPAPRSWAYDLPPAVRAGGGPPSPGRPSWYRARALQLLVTGAVGLAGGAAIGSSIAAEAEARARTAHERAALAVEVASRSDRAEFEAEKQRFKEASDRQRRELAAREAAVRLGERVRSTGGFAGDGFFRVPEDVRPGTYRTMTRALSTCEVSRLREGSEAVSGTTRRDEAGHLVLLVGPTDLGFSSTGCGAFARTD